MFIRPCRPGASPAQVLRRLAERSVRAGITPPAALVGTWFGGGAVLVPSVDLRPVAGTAQAFAAFERVGQLADVDVPPGSVGGGWVGYLGYGLTDVGSRLRRLPLAVGGWADHVLRRDPGGGWNVEALLATGARAPVELADELSALVADAADDPPSWPDTGATGAPRWPHPGVHRAAVESCLDAIAAGEIYQANVCVRVELPAVPAPAELFAAGIDRMAPARAACLTGPWGAAVSFSPELFLARRGDAVRSSPIKGTRPRTASPAELLGSEKDRAENIMITDMVRNDLGRVAVPGSVTVPELLAVRAAPGVWHLVSTVTARLRDGLAPGELLSATFPPASVTGTPKLRAVQLLGRWEPDAREIYCGAIGMASPLAGLELSVAIRTVEVAPDGTAWLGVGGGITIDSDPAEEWQECVDKAAPVLGLLSPRALLTG